MLFISKLLPDPLEIDAVRFSLCLISSRLVEYLGGSSYQGLLVTPQFY